MLYLANNRLLLINNGNSLYRIDSQTQPEPDSSSFIITIDTTLGTGSSFNLPLRYGYNYDFTVDWGDGNTNTITSNNQAEKLHTYSTDGVYTISITGLCEAWYFNYSGDNLKLTSIEQWGDTGFVNMERGFRGCSNLTGSTDSDGGWCSGVGNMGRMFIACSSLTTLDVSNWDTSSVTGMDWMFANCSSLTPLDISNWDVSNVSDMEGMFYYCDSLTELDVSNWHVSNVTSMNTMFTGCSSLTTLDVSNWNVSNVTRMGGMFYGCSSLTTLDVSNWNVFNVNDMQLMFQDCTSLTTLDVSNWNVSNVNDMQLMFQDCTSLTTLDVSNWDVSNVTNMLYMFYNTPLDTPSYDALLIGWSGLPSLQSNVSFHANLSQYSCAAEEAHDTLTSSPNNWTITDLGLNVDSCDEPVDLTTHPRWDYILDYEGLDTFGLNLLPGGVRYTSEFSGIGVQGQWWTSSLGNNPYGKYMSYNRFSLETSITWGRNGYSIRLMRPYTSSDGTKEDGRILTGTFSDADGNSYNGVIIGNQVWSTTNLKTTKYADGTAIPTNWDINTGAYAVYPYTSVTGIDSEQEMINAYGILYNWFAATDARGLSSQGHVPSLAEWTQLSNYLIDNYNQTITTFPDGSTATSINNTNIGKHLKSIRTANP